MDGLDSCSGRVEVFKDGQWGTVCDDGWDLSDAAVVCREVGCGDATEVKRGGNFGRGSGGPIKIHGVNCAGSELMLSSCVSDDGAVDPSVCDISKSAGVICQSLVRLVNGDNSCSGRVEVNHDGRWGTVCDSGLYSWDSIDGQVVCREVGCGDIIRAEVTAYFGQCSGPIWLSSVRCSGLETTVRYCGSSSWGDNICQHESDAGVLCEPIKVVNGSNQCSGTVLILRDGRWGSVCDNGWDVADAQVVCRELGCAREAKRGAYFGEGSGPIWMNNVNCVGDESILSACSGSSVSSCDHTMDAGVICRRKLPCFKTF
ncbi:Soluble scavenger receptor cysteine-rich domain-containing protein SSC5D [Triplophysa tibetana]|uniref:Soluble scavenger receptor cysteine-rich domain-containing protein SSC5D n=1 Tax=Triplophysa tibetana TaxID=1572043 RepID=A0A5A9PJ64_9TELE|nr:Soluble scavenger receptor cysteine-rich domain-containing protein SSC5D [Triplophysa tibetana]